MALYSPPDLSIPWKSRTQGINTCVAYTKSEIVGSDTLDATDTAVINAFNSAIEQLGLWGSSYYTATSYNTMFCNYFIHYLIHHQPPSAEAPFVTLAQAFGILNIGIVTQGSGGGSSASGSQPQYIAISPPALTDYYQTPYGREYLKGLNDDARGTLF